MKEVVTHETLHCLNTMCANELCGASLEHIMPENLVKFTVYRGGDDADQEKIACSKKCKKVARFGFTLKHGSEIDVLNAFEQMMRKKMTKR